MRRAVPANDPGSRRAPASGGNPSQTGAVDPAGLIRECRRALVHGFILAGVFSGFINLLQLTVPLFMLQLHDRVIVSQSTDTLKVLVVLAVGAIALYGFLEFTRAVTFQALAGQLIGRINLPAIRSAMTASLERGSARGTEVLRDLSDLRGFVTGTAFTAPFEALWSPIFLTVMFLLHPLYGLAGVIAIVIMVSLNVLSDVLCRGALREANDANIESITNVAATMRHAEVIEAMGMLPALTTRWRDLHFKSVDLINLGNRRSRGMHALTRATRYVMQIVILALGAYLAIKQEASAGAMIGGTMIVSRLLAPFDSIAADWRQWVFARGAWQRVREVLETPVSARQSFPIPKGRGDLVVDRLVYAVPGVDLPILRGISFTVAPGTILGIAGPSAAGKSTLARLLVGVAKPTAGGVFLNGHNVFLWQRESFGDMVGYLPQAVSLLEGTVRDNIGRMRDADPALIIDAARAAEVHEAIGRLPLGYDTPIGEGRLTLSGGQRQRVALARALFGEPSLLVRDEPNSNLDSEGEQALVRAMRLARERGAIVVVVAHRKSILDCADQILVLQEGRVVRFGDARGTEGGVVEALPVRQTAVAAGGRS